MGKPSGSGATVTEPCDSCIETDIADHSVSTCCVCVPRRSMSPARMQILPPPPLSGKHRFLPDPVTPPTQSLAAAGPAPACRYRLQSAYVQQRSLLATDVVRQQLYADQLGRSASGPSDRARDARPRRRHTGSCACEQDSAPSPSSHGFPARQVATLVEKCRSRDRAAPRSGSASRPAMSASLAISSRHGMKRAHRPARAAAPA